MNKMNIIPITWEGWDSISNNRVTVYKVTFLEDFGVFKQGETYSQLNIHFGDGIIEYYDAKGTQKIQFFKASPIIKDTSNYENQYFDKSEWIFEGTL